VTAPVVYVDDEPAICRIFGWRVEAAGMPVETFTDPEAALAFLREHDARCVVCDYRMPSMTGLDVLECLPRPVPFYLVTGDLFADRELGDHDGVEGVISKPIPFDDVIELLRSL